MSEENIYPILKELLKKGYIETIEKTVEGDPISSYSKKVTIEEFVTSQILAVQAINDNFDIRKLLTALYRNENLNLSLDDVEQFLYKISN